MSNISSWNCWAWPPSKLGRHQTSTTSDVWFSTEQLVGASGRTTKADVIDITDVIGLFVCFFLSFGCCAKERTPRPLDSRRRRLWPISSIARWTIDSKINQERMRSTTHLLERRRRRRARPVGRFRCAPSTRGCRSRGPLAASSSLYSRPLPTNTNGSRCAVISKDFYRVSLGLTAFDWAWQGLTGFLSSLNESSWGSLFTGVHRVLLGFIRYLWVLLGFKESWWTWLGFTGFYWVLLGFIGFHCVLLGFTAF